MAEFVRFYNNGLHIYRVWKVYDQNVSTGAFKFYFELFI